MIIFSTVPRSRSAMLLQTAELLGYTVLQEPFADENNPKGYYRSRYTFGGLRTANNPKDQAIKVMAQPLMNRTEIEPDDKIIIGIRQPSEVAASMQKMGIWFPEVDRIRANYSRIYQNLESWCDRRPNPILWVNTNALVENPAVEIGRIKAFLGSIAEPTAAIKNIDQSETIPDPVRDEAWRVYRRIVRIRCQ